MGVPSVEDTQAQLGTDEVLVFFLDTPNWRPTPEETFIWAITKTDVRWVRIDLGTKALMQHVAVLRCGLDQTRWYTIESADKCKAASRVTPGEEETSGFKVQVLPFDLARAHELYKGLFGPVEDILRGMHLSSCPPAR